MYKIAILLVLMTAVDALEPLMASPTPQQPEWWDQVYATVHSCALTPPLDQKDIDSTTAPTTTLSIGLSNGKVETVKVISSSGNSRLDARAAKCFRRLPRELTDTISTAEIGEIFRWRPDSNTITVQKISPPQHPPTMGGITGPVSSNGPHRCEQMYPSDAIRQGEEGTTFVMAEISVEGTVVDARVVTSSGFEDLDAAAVTCTKQWLFRPAMQNGTPVDAKKEFAIRWALGSATPTSSAPPAAPAHPGPNGWLPGFNRPGIVATYYLPIRQPDIVHTVTACNCGGHNSLDDFIAYRKVQLLDAGVMLLKQMKTTVCTDGAAWDVEISYLRRGSGGKELVFDAEQIATVKNGISYLATYEYPATDPPRPEGSEWVRNYCPN